MSFAWFDDLSAFGCIKKILEVKFGLHLFNQKALFTSKKLTLFLFFLFPVLHEMPVENVFCNVLEWLTSVFYVYVYKEFMHECSGND